MDQPMCLASWSEIICDDYKGIFITQAVSTLTVTDPVSEPNRDRFPFPSNDPNDNWTTVNATVIGDHEISHRVAMNIPVSVPQATVGCDICLEVPSHIKRLVVESTLNRVREGHKTVALVVNTTGGPIKLKSGILLIKALIFDRPVVPEPL